MKLNNKAMLWCILGALASTSVLASSPVFDVNNLKVYIEEQQIKVDTAMEEFAANIEITEELIDEMIKANRKEAHDIAIKEKTIVRQADWYSKPWYESIFVSPAVSYTLGDSVSTKSYDGGTYKTEHDADRGAMAAKSSYQYGAAGMSAVAAASSGWINGTSGYNANTLKFDIESKLLILPIINAPTVSTPEAPVINVTPTTVTPPGAMPAITTVTIPNPTVNPGEPELAQPNANPFSKYKFNSSITKTLLTSNDTADRVGSKNYEKNSSNKILYNGYSSTSGASDYSSYNGSTGTRYETSVYMGGLQSAKDKFSLSNLTLHVAGYLPDKDSSAFTPAEVTALGSKYEGTIGIHTVWNGDLINIEGHLYGKSAFISMESWHGGQLKLSNVNVSVSGSNNSLFYLYPSRYVPINSGHHGHVQRGEISGTLNATINSTGNNIFVQSGISGSWEIEVNGNYILNGAQNTVYSGLGYSPNYEYLKGTGGINTNGNYSVVWINRNNDKGIIGTETKFQMSPGDMKPSIKFTNAPVSNGDENVMLFFSSRMQGNLPGMYQYDGTPPESERKAFIGIYQGQISVAGKIGTDGTVIQADGSGNLTTKNGQATNYTRDYVDGNIGVYSRSGQRPGVVISELGALARKDDMAGTGVDAMADYSKDAIHNLQIGVVDITFGKKSKNGIMFVAEAGTVIDVAHDETPASEKPVMNQELNTTTYDTTKIYDYDQLNTTGTPSDKIIDYDSTMTKVTSSYDDTTNEAATGTIIAYSTGVWSNDTHKYVGTDGKTTSSVTAANLNGKSTEINIFKDVTLSARYKKFKNADDSISYSYPIAYFASNKGIISAVNTYAKGYGSIVAYAENGSTIKITGNIEAKDEWAASDAATTPYLYSNMGAIATIKSGATGISSDSTVTISGNIDVHGLGAYASGSSGTYKSTVTISGTGSNIVSGKDGALVALDGGEIKFGGGDITHGDTNAQTSINAAKAAGIISNNFDSTTPFYANNGGKIDFTAGTTLKMHKGVLFIGEISDYSGASGAGTAYSGMNNLTVTLESNDVNVGIFSGANITYTDSANYFSNLGSLVHVGSMNSQGHTYSSSLKDSTLNIANNIDLDTDDFKKVIATQNVMTNIQAGYTVSSVNGEGLQAGSHSAETTNANNGFKNSGTVTISGGSAPVALYSSYGTITNDTTGIINVDGGIGIAGANGSRLVNDGTISITNSTATVTGVGIVGLRQSTGGADSYGLDLAGGSITGPGAEIINNNLITVGGTHGVGIYASNNSNDATAANAIKITNAGKIVVGDNGAGINVANSVSTTHATLTLTGTGTADITSGSKSTGVYAQNTDINLTTTYGIQTGADSAGIYLKDNSTITGTTGTSYDFQYTDAAGTGSGAAVMYEGSTGATGSSAITVDTTHVGTTGGTIAAIYAKNGGSFTNSGTLILGNEVKGIVSEKTNITNSGTISSASSDTVGIFVKDGDATNDNTGNITLTGKSTGMYGATTAGATAHTIKNSGIITITGEGAAGMYSAGDTNVELATGGTLNLGNKAVGVAGESGNITIDENMSATALGEESTYVYTITGKATINAGKTIDLSDYSVGTFARDYGSEITNKGTINVNKSDATSTPVRVSVGMAAQNGKVVNDTNGVINVSGDFTAGMVAQGDGTKDATGNFVSTGEAVNNGKIYVTGNNSYGMQVSKGAKAVNNGDIYITGNGSRGIAATTNSSVINAGNIYVDGVKSEGIYVENGATLVNSGNIYLKNTTAYGIFYGENLEKPATPTGGISGGDNNNWEVKGGGSIINVGGIVIDGAKVTIDGNPVIFNSGNITVEGELDFDTLTLGTSPHVGSISAESLSGGNIIVLPQVTQGSNQEAYMVQYINIKGSLPNNGQLTAISQSISFVADVQSSLDAAGNRQIQIVMVKVPYEKLLAGTAAENLGVGLDAIYYAASGKELEMFDSMDIISDKSALAALIESEIRGNVYANIQQRMYDIKDAFGVTYEGLLHDRTYTKNSLKVGIIGTGVKREFGRVSVEDYDAYTVGAMAVKEYDLRHYGEKLNWNAGFGYTVFDFDDTDNKEKVYSIDLGLGYERYILGSEALKYSVRGEVILSRHDTDRYLHFSSGTYHNSADFWSLQGVVTNKVRYELPINKPNLNTGIFVKADVGYGMYETFAEDGDGMELQIKNDDILTARPGVGVDANYNIPVKSGKISLYGKVGYDYELGYLYDGANQAKVKDTSAGYYRLAEVEELEGIFTAGVGLQYANKCGNSVGIEVSRYEGNLSSTRAGINFIIRLQ